MIFVLNPDRSHIWSGGCVIIEQQQERTGLNQSTGEMQLLFISWPIKLMNKKNNRGAKV